MLKISLELIVYSTAPATNMWFSMASRNKIHPSLAEDIYRQTKSKVTKSLVQFTINIFTAIPGHPL